MATNSNNVYGTAQPLQGSVSDFVRGQEQLNAQQREEQIRIAAIDEQRKAKDDAKRDKLKNDILGKIPKNYDTGSTSLNQFQAKIIAKGVDRLGDIYKELQNTSLSPDRRIDLELEAQNLQQLPENLKVATDNFSSIMRVLEVFEILCLGFKVVSKRRLVLIIFCGIFFRKAFRQRLSRFLKFLYRFIQPFYFTVRCFKGRLQHL